ncbi:MAG: hypothetical protein NVS9B8_13190 [Candidatus Limnocylindrales bacterium]
MRIEKDGIALDHPEIGDPVGDGGVLLRSIVVDDVVLLRDERAEVDPDVGRREPGVARMSRLVDDPT